MKRGRHSVLSNQIWKFVSEGQSSERRVALASSRSAHIDDGTFFYMGAPQLSRSAHPKF